LNTNVKPVRPGGPVKAPVDDEEDNKPVARADAPAPAAPAAPAPAAPAAPAPAAPAAPAPAAPAASAPAAPAAPAPAAPAPAAPAPAAPAPRPGIKPKPKPIGIGKPKPKPIGKPIGDDRKLPRYKPAGGTRWTMENIRGAEKSREMAKEKIKNMSPEEYEKWSSVVRERLARGGERGPHDDLYGRNYERRNDEKPRADSYKIRRAKPM